MKYIDSFKDMDSSQLLNDKEKEEAIYEARTMIEKSQEMLDDLMSWSNHNQEQIKLHSDCEHALIKEYVDFLKHENELYEIHALLMLYYGDIVIAYKNIMTIYDDWEVRVHIRRIYTLLYEIYMRFCGSAGKPIGYLKGSGNDAGLLNYASNLKNLREYLKKYESQFKEIRNKTEAHKDSEVSLQICLIENISIIDSIPIIEGAINKLNAILKSMTPLFILFESKRRAMCNSIP